MPAVSRSECLSEVHAPIGRRPVSARRYGLAEHWPAIVDVAAGVFAHVGNFTVLNGAEGVNQALMQVEVVGLSSNEFLRGLFVPRGGAAATAAATAAAPAAAPAVVPGVEDERTTQ